MTCTSKNSLGRSLVEVLLVLYSMNIQCCFPDGDVCVFCNLKSEDVERYGQKLKKGSVTVHYYCMVSLTFDKYTKGCFDRTFTSNKNFDNASCEWLS